jgi:hypothetical protein
MSSAAHATVAAVSRNEVYSFSKPVRNEITLLAGIGVQGDVHAGATVRHRGRVKADPTQPNLRQVHPAGGHRRDRAPEPCGQINDFRPGLLKRVLGLDEDGNLIRRAGVMGVVLRGRRIRPGDQVVVELPPPPHLPLERV